MTTQDDDLERSEVVLRMFPKKPNGEFVENRTYTLKVPSWTSKTLGEQYRIHRLPGWDDNTRELFVRNSSQWIVSEVLTGMRVCGRFDTRQNAVQGAHDLFEEIERDSSRANVGEQVLKFATTYGFANEGEPDVDIVKAPQRSKEPKWVQELYENADEKG